MAERIGARNGTGGAVLREIMRLGRNFWARRVWVDFRKVQYLLRNISLLKSPCSLRKLAHNAMQLKTTEEL